MGANLLGLLSLPELAVTTLKPAGSKGILGAFVMGIPFAFVASPFTTPVTTSVLAYASIKGSPVYGFLLLFLYAIGRSIPLLLVGTFTGLVKNIQVIGNWSKVLQKISGIVLIVLGSVLMTPGLIINGKIKSTGKVPKPEDIAKW